MDTKKLNYIPQNLNEVSQEWVEMALLGDQMADAVLPPFRLEFFDANNSNTARLVFAYEPQNLPLPSSLILKICPNGHEFLGASEPNYYTRDYVDLTSGPLVRCYKTVGLTSTTSDSVGNGYAIFLEDLGVGYSDNKLKEPDSKHAVKLGRALGQLHAHRWGATADPEGPHDLHADFQRYFSHVSKGLKPIIDNLGNELSPASRSRLNKVFSHDADQMMQRALYTNGLALVHGDANPTNVLTSNNVDEKDHPLYLIDRQPFDWSLRLWIGASDLVYATVPFWDEDNRRALQDVLMVSYHDTLIENGVRSYSKEDLLEDWKSCACISVFTAIQWGTDPASLKEMKWLWKRQLQRALSLLEDCDSGNLQRHLKRPNGHPIAP